MSGECHEGNHGERGMRIQVEDATVAHLDLIEEDVRMADLMEWYGATGLPFGKTSRITLDEFSPGYKKVALRDGLPLCFWGMDGEGSVWLFATKTAERYALSLHRILKPELGKMLALCPRLTALADSRNTLHHTWLDWLGFKQEDELFIKPFGLPYKLFSKEAAPCV